MFINQTESESFFSLFQDFIYAEKNTKTLTEATVVIY